MMRIIFMAASAAIVFAVGFAQPAEAKKRNRLTAHVDVAAIPSYPTVQSPRVRRDSRYVRIERGLEYVQPSSTADNLITRETYEKLNRGRRPRFAQQTQPAFGGFTSNSLVSEARKYIGTNPTGRGSLWCGAFMDMVLKKTGHAGGGNLASAYARYGTRVSGPQVGAIAVMGRRGGGHVGIVTGIDANGNPVIISGNTWSRESGGRRSVLEHAYPRGRIYAYVVP